MSTKEGCRCPACEYWISFGQLALHPESKKCRDNQAKLADIRTRQPTYRPLLPSDGFEELSELVSYIVNKFKGEEENR